MITYYKNQIDLANSLKNIIDKYWAMEVDEEEFIKYLKQVAEKNKDLLYKEGDYTTTVRQKLGVKRLGLLTKILENS
ncbi:MAG: TIGR04540 family protein [Tissierellia bacterium]|nr:TIGR04540 family protein [Tissierellia bacterium]